MTDIIKIQEEINTQISSPQVLNALVSTTFKGLEVNNVKRALMEGMMRGYTFKDFLEKNIYAIPYGNTYSLVTSIDYARKVGMRSGVIGKTKPEFEEKDEKIISCTVTVKRKLDDHVGEYTETVFFDEYNTGRNLWKTKPRTMIAKVAEMHALRMACPEELSQSYTEEEVQKEATIEAPAIDLTSYEEKLKATKNLDELKKVWADMPVEAKQKLETLKTELKNQYADTKVSK